MTTFIRYGLIILLLLVGKPVIAADSPVAFTNPLLQERYYALIGEIRCLVCQNQSLADSHADLAQDLRLEIYQMLLAGAQDEQIIAFLVERYGDFVLYRPPLTKSTWPLWFGPFLLLLFGTVIAIIMIKKYGTDKATNTKLTESQQQRLTTILTEDSTQERS